MRAAPGGDRMQAGHATAQHGTANVSAVSSKSVKESCERLSKDECDARKQYIESLIVHDAGGDYMQEEAEIKTIELISEEVQPECKRVKKGEFVGEKKQIKTLTKKAGVSLENGQPSEAIILLKQALALTRQIGSHPAESQILYLMGSMNEELGQNREAINNYKRAANLRRQCGLTKTRSYVTVTNNLCGVYHATAQYAKAINACHDAITVIDQHNLTHAGVLVKALTNQGLNYTEIGQYDKAIRLMQRALPLQQALPEKKNPDKSEDLAKVYHNLAFAYFEKKKYEQAYGIYQQALALRRQANDQKGLASTWNNMGFLRLKQGRYKDALTLLDKALQMARHTGDRYIEGRTLDSLGDVYAFSGDYAKALDYYNQSLVIKKLVDDRRGERITLGNIGKLLEQQGRETTAIVFYKQAVMVSEAIREGLDKLSADLSSAYALKVAEIYRRLADLLLKHDRVIEAQQVLDLLQVQELEDYLQQVRGGPAQARVPGHSDEEQRLADDYFQKLLELMRLTQQTSALRSLDRELSPQEEAQLIELDEKESQLSENFTSFLDSEEIRQWEASRADIEKDAALRIKELASLQDNLRQIGKVVLLYPLVLDERLELVVTTAEGTPVHKPVSIASDEVISLVNAYLHALRNPARDVTPHAKKLYKLLIEPIEAVLEQVEANTIIFVPDGVLRYIPLSALYDGKKWLVESYRIHRITNTTQSDLNKRPSERKLFAGAFSQGSFDIVLGDEQTNFKGLKYAGLEVDNLKKTIPDTIVLLNEKFTPQKTRLHAKTHTALHLATHAAFVAGHPSESFILFGDGDRLTLKQVHQQWQGKLRDINLVVLSACQTAVGGVRIGNGEEILGFGYLMEQAGADASIATLWKVDDGGTQVLMNAFYRHWQKPGVRKAQALQLAQQALIHSDKQGSKLDRGGVPIEDIVGKLSHPYYWAPFILIGNGL